MRLEWSVWGKQGKRLLVDFGVQRHSNKQRLRFAAPYHRLQRDRGSLDNRRMLISSAACLCVLLGTMW